MHRLTIWPGDVSNEPDVSVAVPVSLTLSICVCVFGCLSMPMSKCCFIACGRMGRSQAAVPRQMDTHTSIIIINSMKGSPGATAEAMVAGQLRQPFRR